eukprot:6189013-Pleurochrysis_carterae.AAC.2
MADGASFSASRLGRSSKMKIHSRLGILAGIKSRKDTDSGERGEGVGGNDRSDEGVGIAARIVMTAPQLLGRCDVVDGMP